MFRNDTFDYWVAGCKEQGRIIVRLEGDKNNHTGLFKSWREDVATGFNKDVIYRIWMNGHPVFESFSYNEAYIVWLDRTRG